MSSLHDWISTLKPGFHAFLLSLRVQEWRERQLPAGLIMAGSALSLFLVWVFGARKSRRRGEMEEPLLQKHGGAAVPGWWSRVTFRWLNPVIEAGRREKLELRHLPQLAPEETAEHCFSLLKECRKRKKGKGATSLSRALLLSVWKPLALNAIFAGVNTLSSYVGPYLITAFVSFLSSPSSPQTLGYALSLLLFASKTLESLSQRHWFFGARRLSLRLRASLLSSLYLPSLSTPPPSSLLDVDAERIADFSFYVHSIWLLPLQLSLSLFLLRANLGGAAAAAALAATVLIMCAAIPLASSQETLNSHIMSAKDARIAATQETLKAMKTLKLHAWESSSLQKILALRDKERSWLKKYLYTCSAAAFLFWASPAVVSVAAFLVSAAAGNALTPARVLAALATFRILQEPIYNLPELVAVAAQTRVSLERVQKFLDSGKGTAAAGGVCGGATVVVEPGEYRWGGAAAPTLKIEKRIEIKRGERVGICGSVAAGKTSLLCCMIGEMRGGGGAAVEGRRAYVAQRAWVQTGTVRENILFGGEMERERYEEVVRACGLERDISEWSDGDRTAVGERGVNLSGGQKQRIQLARAAYGGADVFFLDDPFSAVDAHTANHLFKECLMRLLEGKTVVFVTHQLEFLSAADRVLVMKEGKVVQAGRYEELAADGGGEFVRQMAAHHVSLGQVPACKGTREGNVEREREEEGVTEEYEEGEGGGAAEEDGGGRVGWGVYAAFTTAAYGGALVPGILACQVMFLGLQMASSYWMAWGIGRREKVLGVFVVLSLGSSVFVLGRALLLATVALETGQRLFRGMIGAVFRAPVAFFDSTPSSRILNRSSNDQNAVDTDIPYRLAGLVFALVQLLGIIILMSMISWIIFILFVIILATCYWYQTYYVSTARELGRMVAMRKGPILHHFSESIGGAATIRCFRQEERFVAKSFSLIDDYSRATYNNSATMEWFSLRINFFFNLVFFVMLVFLVTVERSAIDPSLAGLAATYGLTLNVLQAWVIWNLCNVENKMISVERILQYSKIPSEAPLINDSFRPNPSWPANGDVDFEDLCVRYSPEHPLVLKGISCKFPGNKKVAVVGRTGSGKSTLIHTLFRVMEPCGGRILIDGVDISMIGLHDLRSRLSIIPQEPLIFRGTVRTNLDPLQQHSDHEIWEVLRKCHLGDIVQSDPRLLDAPVAEDGENWSVGQRQMVCLARALLKKRKILVLDEATASVDTATDNLIQKTIRDETGCCTVITVAHRIPTIVDNDLVLVLGEGRVVEFDSPPVLLKERGSEFSKLAMEFLRRSGTNYHP